MTSGVASGFNAIAPFYQLLSKLVFGNSLQRAQEHFLSSIKEKDQILILGGGSGALLKSILELKLNVTIDYIDISTKMIQLARKKTHSSSNVNFIVGTEQNIPNREYSVVITAFYLDLFADKTLITIVDKIQSLLKADGHWLTTDFVSKTSWHKIMLWMMYRFFRITTGIEARTLPDWENQLTLNRLKAVITKDFYKGFIRSSQYVKA